MVMIIDIHDDKVIVKDGSTIYTTTVEAANPNVKELIKEMKKQEKKTENPKKKTTKKTNTKKTNTKKAKKEEE